MNKSLNDIKDLKSAFISHCKELGCEDLYIKVCKNKFTDIEKDLKRLKTIDEVGVVTGTLTTEQVRKEIDDYIKIKKKLKALEIIKEKNVDVWALKTSLPELTYEKYLQVNKIPQFAYSEIDLTQEEFDLLKEELK